MCCLSSLYGDSPLHTRLCWSHTGPIRCLLFAGASQHQLWSWQGAAADTVGQYSQGCCELTSPTAPWPGTLALILFMSLTTWCSFWSLWQCPLVPPALSGIATLGKSEGGLPNLLQPSNCIIWMQRLEKSCWSLE